MMIKRIKLIFRRLMWKLTLSYTAVTVGSLLIVVLILGYLLFSSIFIPLDFIDRELSPRDWIRMIEENSSHIWRPVLKQDPIDLELVSALMKESNLQITSRDLLNIADFQISMRTVAQGSGFIIGSDGSLLGIYNSNLVGEDDVGPRPAHRGSSRRRITSPPS